MLKNLEAEQTLIGLAVTDYECAEKFIQLPQNTFAFPATVNVYCKIKSMMLEHRKIDAQTVCMAFNDDDTDERATILAGSGMAISPVMYKEYEAICLDLRKRRMLVDVCSRIANQAQDRIYDVDKLEGDLQGIINDTGNKPQSIAMIDATTSFATDLTDKKVGIYTGIAGIDSLTGGLQEGMFVVVGARPGVGKSALAISIARHVASKSGPVLMVSLEMTEKEIIARMVASDSGVDLTKLITKNIGDDEWEGIWNSTQNMYILPMRFTMASTPLQIRREASAMQRDGGLKLIIIDYIQLMRTDSYSKSRYEQISDITRELKLMAMELEVPILGLTQFNRMSESEGKKKFPTMAEARDSGSIEQDANMFIIQHPPNDPDPSSAIYPYWLGCKTRGHELQILRIEKNRHGRTGDILVEFDKPHMRFMTMKMGE